MELLTLKITPISTFATLPKGDTLFGQIVAYFFLNGDNSFENYLNEKPKLIVSDMMPINYVYRPTLPIKCFENPNGNEADKKLLRKQRFISLENLQNGNLHLCEKVDFVDEIVSIKNSINRTTFTTDGNNFAPYGMRESLFFKKLWMFVLVDTSIKNKVLEIIEDIGKFGFGKKANLGKGNFDIELISTQIKSVDTNYFMSISPILQKDNNIEYSWYEPFTRFGKLGLHNAYTNAFKKPVLMADSGAVVKLKESKQFFGSCLDNGVDIVDDRGDTKRKVSHLQGYSIAIPIGIKDISCLNIK